MNIRGSRYRLDRSATRDPEDVELEQSQTEHRVEIAGLKERHARLEREIAELRGKIKKPNLQPCMQRDTLTWLPSWRGHDFAQAIVGSDVVKWDLREAWEQISDWMEMCRRFGITDWFLDSDHDFKTKAFALDRLYFRPNEAIYAEGSWTPAGMNLRRLFMGVSPAWIFPGASKKFELPPKYLEAKRREWEEDIKEKTETDEAMAWLGAVCFRCPPTFTYYNQADLEAIKSASSNETNIAITNQNIP
jgi:hypothetical protein